MRILGFDIETTGLNPHVDRVIELAFVLWDVEEKKPITLNSFLLHADKIDRKVELLTGITQDMLDDFSVLDRLAVAEFNRNADNAVAYVAHNGINFDVPFTQKLVKSVDYKWMDLPVVDTRTDLLFPPEVSSRKMDDIALVHGVTNPFAHRGLTDTLVMLEILSRYNVQAIIEHVVTTPLLTITADKYTPDGFWAWKERKCYRRKARQFHIDKELAILREKYPDTKFDVVEPKVQYPF